MLPKREIISKAKAFCEENQINGYPVSIVNVCQNYDITVFEEYLPLDVSGFIVIQPEPHKKYKKEKFIVVNLYDNAARRRFTIAHELAHYVLHKQEDETLYAHRDAGQNGGIETEANIFASNILMPEDLIKTAYKDSASLLQYSRIRIVEYIAKQFAVSLNAAEIRLKDLKLI